MVVILKPSPEKLVEFVEECHRLRKQDQKPLAHRPERPFDLALAGSVEELGVGNSGAHPGAGGMKELGPVDLGVVEVHDTGYAPPQNRLDVDPLHGVHSLIQGEAGVGENP